MAIAVPAHAAADVGRRAHSRWVSRSAKMGSPTLAAPRGLWLNSAMQMRRPTFGIPARRAAKGVAAAPLMAALGLASTVISAVVAFDAATGGRLPANGSIGVVCALVLAAAAMVEASRAARLERAGRRLARPLDAAQDVSDVDLPTTSRWR
jgi:hypothetical protein